MLNINEIELNDDGRVVGMRGTFKKSKIFSITTDYILYWAELELDYIGGGIKYESKV